MAGQRPLEPKTDKKAVDQTVVISLQEFLRTRDSVVSGLNTLVGVIHELNNAYVKHTGDLLTAAGVSPEILTQYAVNYMSLPPKSSLLTGGLNALNPDVKVKKKRVKKEKDPNAPKRPLTAFFLYSTYARPEVRKQLPNEATPVAVNDEILKRWKEMPTEEKETWKEKYEENNRRYKVAVAEYKTKTGVDPDAAEHHEGAEDVDEEDAEEGAGEPDEEEEGEDEDDDEEPAKPPTPPPTKAKKAKATKGKAKENGAPAVSSPSPSAQLRAPAEVSPPAKKADKKRKSEKDAEEPKKKKTKAEEKETSSPLASKDKKKKRKGEA